MIFVLTTLLVIPYRAVKRVSIVQCLVMPNVTWHIVISIAFNLCANSRRLCGQPRDIVTTSTFVSSRNRPRGWRGTCQWGWSSCCCTLPYDANTRMLFLYTSQIIFYVENNLVLLNYSRTPIIGNNWCRGCSDNPKFGWANILWNKSLLYFRNKMCCHTKLYYLNLMSNVLV